MAEHTQPENSNLKRGKELNSEDLAVNIGWDASSEAVSLLLCAGIVQSKLFCADHTEASVHLHSWRYFHLKNSNQDIQELFTLVLNSL